jgi:hypothetical protein
MNTESSIEDIEELAFDTEVARIDLWNGLPDDNDSNDIPAVKRHTGGKLRLKRAAKAIERAKQREEEERQRLDLDTGSDASEPSKPYTASPPTTFLPGTQTVYIKTYGCSHNRSDSEVMAGLLAEQGYSVLLDGDESDRGQADVWLVNSCSVKNPSELAFVKEIARAKETGKKVVLAGCVAQHSPRDPRWDGLSVVGVQQIERVVEVVEETLKGNSVQLVRERTEMVEVEDGAMKKKKSGGAPLSLPKIRRNPFVEIIPINTGCLNEW